MQLTIIEAAEALSVSPQTVRRRLLSGLLNGEQVPTPQGFRWMVHMPDPGEPEQLHNGTADDALVALLKSQVEDLRDQLAVQNQQVDRLTQLWARALSEGHSKPWWRFWR